MALKIKSIRKLPDKYQTVDIEVADTHSYQLDNGAVSHNSVLLRTASGIHAEHSPRYLRSVQMTKDSEVAQLLAETNPYMVEESVWSAGKTDYVISFPIIAPEGSLYREELQGLDLLKKIALVQNNWVEHGTNVSRCADPTIRHNVSNTVTVRPDEWHEVEEYVYANMHTFSGIAFLASTGDKDYHQAPMAEVLTEREIVDKYGRAALFASGLIVDTRKGFDSLWDAISVAKRSNTMSGELSDIRADWIRRFRKFVDNYFDGDDVKAEYCLKDIQLLHKWTKIQQNLSMIDFLSQLEIKKYVDADTMGSAACVGGACEVDF